LSNVVKSCHIYLNQEKRFALQKSMQGAVHRDESLDGLGGSLQKLSESKIDCVLEAAERQAESIRDKAREEAKSMVAHAASEADRIRELARQEGFQAGFEKGLQTAKELFLSEIDQAQKIKDQIVLERETLYEQFERDLVNLALDIAKRVIYDRLEADDTALKHVVESTLQKIKGRAKVQLRISKYDYQKILDLKNTFVSKLQYLENLDIIQDDLLSPGSCIVDTGSGVIDGGVHTRIKEIETALVGG